MAQPLQRGVHAMAAIDSCPSCGRTDRTVPEVREGQARTHCERCDVTWWDHPACVRWSPETDDELLRESMARLRGGYPERGSPASA